MIAGLSLVFVAGNHFLYHPTKSYHSHSSIQGDIKKACLRSHGNKLHQTTKLDNIQRITLQYVFNFFFYSFTDSCTKATELGFKPTSASLNFNLPSFEKQNKSPVIVASATLVK